MVDNMTERNKLVREDNMDCEIEGYIFIELSR